MVGFPVEILTGQLGPNDLAAGFAIQLAWLVLALALTRLVWRLGLKHYSAVGG
jgi:ABC-2 type transport system permease protein